MSVAKYHHRIPQTYMKAWCFSGDTVWLYDKDAKESKPRNIGSIMGVNYFHAIKAGSIFTTEKALDTIFAPLDGLKIFNVDDDEQKELNSKEDFNRYFYNFENWIIQDESGNNITRKQRNILFKRISQASDNSIEDAWSQKYENGWSDAINEIHQAVIDIHNHKEIMLTDKAADTIMDYFVIFQWRSSRGYDEAKRVFDWLMNMVPEISRMELEDSVHREDKTVADEMWHNFLLSTYSKFLDDDGVMKTEKEEYFRHLTFLFLIDSKERLITSDNPCFTFTNKDGYKEPILIALPGLIISLAKKDTDAPNSYRIYEMEDEDVEYYNRVIYENGNQIISRSELDESFRENDEVDPDCPPLTDYQINYIKTQQSKADAEVSNPSSPFFEPDESKRFTASRALMRKWEKEHIGACHQCGSN